MEFNKKITFRYSNYYYSLIVLFTTFVLVFLISGSTNSVKSFLSFREGFGSNIFIKDYPSQVIFFSILEPSQSINVNNNQVYTNNNGQIISQKVVDQNFKMSFLPKVADNNPITSSEQLLSEVVKIPFNPERKNFLIFPKFNINTPIVYSDSFSSQDIIDPNNPCSQASMNTPFQQLVRKGVVHLWPSPKPGELYNADSNSYYDTIDKKRYYIGNSYLLGHSSECIAHEFSRVFAPLQDQSPLGEDFFVYDEFGRQLKFRVFEAKEITSLGAGAVEAFKIFPNRRVITLQTSKFYSNTNINRWIIRGELII